MLEDKDDALYDSFIPRKTVPVCPGDRCLIQAHWELTNIYRFLAIFQVESKVCFTLTHCPLHALPLFLTLVGAVFSRA